MEHFGGDIDVVREYVIQGLAFPEGERHFDGCLCPSCTVDFNWQPDIDPAEQYDDCVHPRGCKCRACCPSRWRRCIGRRELAALL